MIYGISATKDYAPSGTAAERLLEYPFLRPEDSYLTNGTLVFGLPNEYDEFCETASQFLKVKGVAPMSERTPVLAYGANASPFKLAEKMGGKFTPLALREEMQIVPSIRAEMDDTAIVWHGKPGQIGSVFAELYQADDTKGVVSNCHVQFLTNEQIALLHATEGITYHFAPITVRAGSDAHRMEALAYVAGKSEVLLQGGKPVLVKPLTKETTATTMIAAEAVEFMLIHAGDAVDTHDPVHYIESAPATLAEKKARQAAVRAALGTAGLSRAFTFAAAAHRGRADFNGAEGHSDSTKPYPLELMETVLERFDASRLVAVIRNRAHDEIAQQLANKK